MMDSNEQKLITVFTPTYNRSKELSVLYDSLVKQSNKNFMWLIVDDGSIDNTEKIVSNWICDAHIHIKYIKQKNQGKSIAHNLGVTNTFTELFVCVDSDDYLSEYAIEEIQEIWKLKNESDVGILAFRAVTKSKKKLLAEYHVTLRDAYEKLGITGDTMLVYKTGIISQFEFPKIEGEKFVPEAYIYDQIDNIGKLLVLPKVLYYGEYLDDGYTKNMSTLLKKNPQGYLVFINQRLKFDLIIKNRIKNTIRYIAMAKVNNNTNIVKNAIYPGIAFFLYPCGYLFYIIRYKK